jgi:ABC-type Fe3+-hydroxamate transport system substrate-binding protein
MNADDAHRRAGALFKKEQQLREAQQAMAEYQAELQATREKTARLRALRLARDAANQSTPSANQ